MKAVPWLALALAMVGTLMAAGAYSRMRSNTNGEGEDFKARIAHLESELAQSRERLTRLEGQPRTPRIEVIPSPGSDAVPADYAELKRRVEMLERQRPAGRTLPNEPNRPSRVDPGMVETMKKRLLDPAQQPRARAFALSMLRQQGAHKADDVVDAALALLAQATEPNIKALIVRNLQGSENPRLIPHLLAVLKGDPDEDVRDESARVLGDFVDQPEAKAALELAAANDASAKVRRRAQGTLPAPK